MLAGAAWIIWLLYDFVYSSNHIELSLEQRTAFVSMWVAIVGFSLAVAGTVIAVLQFQASQEKPDLYLWMEDVGQETLVVTTPRKGFALILENRGKRVARYVKCEIEFLLPRFLSGAGYDRRIEFNTEFYQYMIPFWDLSPWEHRTVATFRGQDKYVCYDDDSQKIGVFWLRRAELNRSTYEVEYTLRCEGMPEKEGVLWIEVR